MSEEVIIRDIQDSDYSKLAKFHFSFPGDERTFEDWINRFNFWWNENPAYNKGHSRGVIAIFDGEVIGTTNNFPTRMLWDGEEKNVINGSTWRVLSNYRNISMDIWDKHRDLTKGFVLFNTTAMPQVIRLLKILKLDEYTLTSSWFYYFGVPKMLYSSFKLHLASLLQKILLPFITLKSKQISITKEKSINES